MLAQSALNFKNLFTLLKEINPLNYTEITVPWEPVFADWWMGEFYDMWMDIPYEDDMEEYKEFPENLGSSLVGIRYLTVEIMHSFLEEKLCIIFVVHF